VTEKNSKIAIAVEKSHLPPGKVLLSDASVLTEGFQDALARIIQQQLGYQVRGRLRKEAKDLSEILLVGVSEGSGVLECETFSVSESNMSSPATTAAFELVASIENYNRMGAWPPGLSSSVRNRLGRAVSPIISGSDETATIIISVEENGLTRDCYIDSSVEEALQSPEEFSTVEQVELVGKIYDINVDNSTFKLDTGQGRTEIVVEESDLDTVDDLRWKRVFVAGFPTDERCRKIENISGLRLAEDEEVDGIRLPNEMRNIERTEALVVVKDKAEDIRNLPDRWDSYHASSPSRSTVDFAIHFLRDAATMCANYDVELPVPFFAPMINGGVQFEWEKADRELELEISKPNYFSYLKISGDVEDEGFASRWEVMRLIYWIATGEQY